MMWNPRRERIGRRLAEPTFLSEEVSECQRPNPARPSAQERPTIHAKIEHGKISNLTTDYTNNADGKIACFSSSVLSVQSVFEILFHIQKRIAGQNHLAQVGPRSLFAILGAGVCFSLSD